MDRKTALYTAGSGEVTSVIYFGMKDFGIAQL